MKRRLLALMTALCLLCGCTATAPTPSKAEWRGVWLSYLDLRPLLQDADPITAAKRLDGVMDTCASYGLHTVFFHVRSHGDAYYPSAVYPAAKAVQALLQQRFDPLAYATEAAHKRGLALHAWVNPYRQADGVADPADHATRRQVLDGVEEILQNYAVDGIHYDDYFYPTDGVVEGESIPQEMDPTLWRQTQVDSLVGQTYRLCHRYGRVFGVSPAADIERNRTRAYADVARWMAQPGYIDYVIPQLYTGFQHESHPFPVLLEEWASLPRREGVALYIGLALYKAGLNNDPYAGKGAAEWAQHNDIIARQVTASRTVADGFALFRYENLTHPAAKDEMKNLSDIL